MAIFARRVIQRQIDACASLIPTSELRGKVALFDSRTRETLATEWELTVLATLMRFGTVRYEPADWGGARKPDLHFRGTGEHAVEFLADITCVSDEGREKENPYDYLHDEFNRLVKKRGLSGAGFHIDVLGQMQGAYGDRKMRLRLPPKGQLPAWLQNHVMPWLSLVRAAPQQAHKIRFDDATVGVEFRFDPRKRFAGGGHPSYSVAYSKTANPVANRLRDKAKQLSGSKFPGLRGIVVCDNGCEIVRLRHFNHGSHFTLRDIIAEFFASNRSVAFVVTLSVTETDRLSHVGMQRSVATQLFVRPTLDEVSVATLERLFTQVGRAWPVPEATPRNALAHLDGADGASGYSSAGGFTMNDKTITLSCREVVAVLGGIDQPTTFVQEHTRDPKSNFGQPVNFFLFQLAQGRMLRAVRVERCDNVDDDRVTFEFDGPDPAISPYKLPTV